MLSIARHAVLPPVFARALPLQGYAWFFLGYEATVNYFLKNAGPGVHSKADLNYLQVMAAGVVAGFGLWGSMFPIDTVKSKLQVRRKTHSRYCLSCGQGSDGAQRCAEAASSRNQSACAGHGTGEACMVRCSHLACAFLFSLRPQADSFIKPQYSSTLDCLSKTVKAEGQTGLWRGFSAAMYRAIPVNAGIFLAVEATRQGIKW